MKNYMGRYLFLFVKTAVDNNVKTIDFVVDLFVPEESKIHTIK